MDNWDRVYGERLMTIWEPHEALVQFVARFLKKRLTYGKYQEHRQARRVLDLGCGNGSQSLFLAQAGYEVCGIDVSTEAIQFAREFIDREGHSATLMVEDCEELSFDDDVFDVVVCHGVLDHIPMKKAVASVQEVRRVLKKGGLFWVTLASTRSLLFGKGKRQGIHTYLIEEGCEQGEIQHYFDEEEIHDLLPGDSFMLRDVRHQLEEVFTCDNGSLHNNAWTGRWFLTAEAV